MSVLTEIEQQSTLLSDQERVQLALFLLQSLKPVDESVGEGAWRQKAETRLTQVNEAPRKNTQHWSLEYADFITVYNRTVEAEGLALEAWRNF